MFVRKLCSQQGRKIVGLPRNVSNSRSVKWNHVVREAEKAVGYSTSFLNLRWLLSDELANVAAHLKKLLGVGHPILKIARDLILQNNTPFYGLIVLLMSKVGGIKTNFSAIEQDLASGILHKQRVLAEVTEMMRTSNLLHRSLINIDSETADKSDMYFGNKIGLLSGDYLLSHSFQDVANFRNQDVSYLVAASLRDFSECEFLGTRDSQNRPIPSKPNSVQEDLQIPDEFDGELFKYPNVLGNTKAEWTLRTLLSGGSLLARACQSSMKLADHPEAVQKKAFLIGKYLSLAWQAKRDRNIYSPENRGDFNLINAPLMFHLENNPNNYAEIEAGFENIESINYELLRKLVSLGDGIERTKDLQKENTNNALEVILTFPDTKPRSALINITNELKR